MKKNLNSVIKMNQIINQKVRKLKKITYDLISIDYLWSLLK